MHGETIKMRKIGIYSKEIIWENVDRIGFSHDRFR